MTTIPDAAIEAAARVRWQRHGHDFDSDEQPLNETREVAQDSYLTNARAELEAALPHLTLASILLDPFNEDGYCGFCGNGRWKHHGPDCRWQDAVEGLTPAPQAEGDVREAVVRETLTALRTAWRDDYSACTVAEGVTDHLLSSGLVVPVGELEHLRGAIDHYAGRHEALAETLEVVKDRIDDFTYDELASDIADEATDFKWEQAYRSRLSKAEAERDAALAAVEAIRSARSVFRGHDVRSTALGRLLDAIDAPRAAPSAIPARLLSGEHVGREVVLPDGTRGALSLITQGPHVVRPRLDHGWAPDLAPDDVVTLVDEDPLAPGAKTTGIVGTGNMGEPLYRNRPGGPISHGCAPHVPVDGSDS